jgi:hypothetical protein
MSWYIPRRTPESLRTGFGALARLLVGLSTCSMAQVPEVPDLPRERTQASRFFFVRKSLALAGSSTATGTTVTPSAESSFCSLVKVDISARHGGHHVAQNASTISCS